MTIDSLVPVLTGPSALTVQQAAPTLLGFQLAEAGNYAGETFTVSVTDSNGKLSATGNAVSGSGSTKITVTGSLSDVNAALTTLTDTDSRQPDSLHVAASDSLGNSTTINAPVTIDSLVPVLTGPSALTLRTGNPTAVALGLAEADSYAGETFTITASESNGQLIAFVDDPLSLVAITGLGTDFLTITGQLAGVNSALATLTDTNSGSSDTLHLNATDSLGNSSGENIAVTVVGPFTSLTQVVLVSPTSVTTQQTNLAAIAGVTITELGNVSGDLFTVTVSDEHGLLLSTDYNTITPDGAIQILSGTNSLLIVGLLPDVNKALAKLHVFDTVAGAEKINLTVVDALGTTAQATVALTVTPLAANFAAPAVIVVPQATATQFGGVTVYEAGSFFLETFSVTASDTHGLLSASGDSVSGSGTSTITINGSLDDVNEALATLTDQISTGANDTIKLSLIDSFGNTAARTVAVSTTLLAPLLVGPSAATLQPLVASTISGLHLSEAGSVAVETFNLTAMDSKGSLMAGGMDVSGLGTHTLTADGTLAELNSVLATLTDIHTTTGSGELTLSVADSFNNETSLLIALAVEPPLTPACYLAGTHILTEHGERVVEMLQVGDVVITASGARRPVHWIGRRSYAGRLLAANPSVQPIRFNAGSLGDGLPHRDLLVSPEHSMLLEGILIPARLLVNNTTVWRQPALARVEYFHVELESHDVLLAEGASSESFVDDDSRAAFHNVFDYWHLYGTASTPAKFCAPRVEHGPIIEVVRDKLSKAVPDGRVCAA